MKQLFSVGFLTLVLFSVSAQQLKPVIYTDGNQKLNGLVTSNTGKKLQGVLFYLPGKGQTKKPNKLLQIQKKKVISLLLQIFTVKEMYQQITLPLPKLQANTNKIIRLIKKELVQHQNSSKKLAHIKSQLLVIVSGEQAHQKLPELSFL